MSRARTVVILASAAVASALIMNAVNGFSGKTSFEAELKPDTASYADRHVERAIHLLEHGTLGDEARPFLGGFARGPIEAVFMAVAFLLFGRTLWSVWALQMAAFVLAVLLLYAISRRFLAGVWSIVPPLMLALFWGASLYVFNLNNEIWSLVFILGFIYSLTRYDEQESPWQLLVAGASLSLLVLAKPIFEYFIPLALLLLVLHISARRKIKTALVHGAFFAAAVLVMVGGWHLRNMAVLGTPKISAGGHALLIRAQSDIFSPNTMKGFFIAGGLGDFIADKIVPGYASTEEPRNSARQIFNVRRPELRRSGLSEFKTDEIFFHEASAIIREHPIWHVAVSVPWLLRMNSPPNFTGTVLDRLFVGTHTAIPDAQKILIILVIRLPWYFFVGIAWWMAARELYRGWRHASIGVWMAVLIFYTNAIYAFLAHAEVRYVLVVMPFYFFFFMLFFASRRGGSLVPESL